jgi:hypothetical protein
MRILLLAILLLGISSVSEAQSLLETTNDARARHSADNYNTYRNNGNSAPLGGYSGTLGSSQPSGTLTPGLGSGYKSGTTGTSNGYNSSGSSIYGQPQKRY